MTVLIAIPARYASTRYPGKPLVSLRGPDGEKTLIRRSWEAAMTVRGVDRVVVATDDDRIKTHAEAFGAEVVMTSSNAQNGTERCAEVVQQLTGYDVVVNLQGDANFLEQAVFVDQITAESAQAMQRASAQAWRDALRTVMPVARERFDADAAQAPAAKRTHRARFGVYFFSDTETPQ